MTGITGIIPDPGYVGGGMHEITSGGFLKVHADFNRHKQLHLDRRLDAILYLNSDWEDSWGGQLELWDRSMSEAVVSLAPVAGRLVCFATDDYSYHGHPDPLTCPPDRFRRSLALYYYTNGRPAEEISGDHTTLFQARPGERIAPSWGDVKAALRRVKRRVTARGQFDDDLGGRTSAQRGRGVAPPSRSTRPRHRGRVARRRGRRQRVRRSHGRCGPNTWRHGPEVEAGDKTGALNLGDSASDSFPRFYVDADVVVSASDFQVMAARLGAGVEAAAPALHLEERSSSWPVRSYHRYWAALPGVRHSPRGAGATA